VTKIRLLKDIGEIPGGIKAGEIIETSKESAKAYVNRGKAEYYRGELTPEEQYYKDQENKEDEIRKKKWAESDNRGHITPNNNEAATFYYNQGFNTIPINGRTKVPYIKWEKYQSERIQQEDFDKWVTKGLFKDGIALICGYNGLHAIDIDNKEIVTKINIDLLAYAQKRYWVEETKKGYHIIARTLKPIPKFTHNGGIDYLGSERLCIVAPSPDKQLIGFEKVTDLPDLIIDDELYATYMNWSGKKEKAFKDYQKGVNKGERNNSMFVLTCKYRDELKPEYEAIQLVLEANKKNTPPLTDTEITNLVKQAYKYPASKTYDDMNKFDLLFQYRAFYYDENGDIKINCPSLAKLLTEADNEYYRIIRDNQDIIKYNGSYFIGNAEKHLGNRINYYCGTKTTNRIKQETLGFIKNMDYIDRDELDQPLNLINFKNGILDINTWEIIEHDPQYTFQNEIPVDFKKEAKCPAWETFIDDVIYPEDKNFMQEVCGYLLYRRYTWAVLVILLGHGRNGKTTFISVMTEILGKQNTEHIPLQTIAHDQHAKVKLYQMHANLCSEIGSQEIKNTEALKQLTGTDTIYARQIYKEGFDFRNYAKLIFSCNVLPDIKDETLAMTERLAILEFPNTFERDDPECDPNIFYKLTTPEELSGILNWMITGLKRLLENMNFSPYKDFENLVKYKRECEDPIYKFIDQELKQNEKAIMLNEELYKHYKKYCDEQNPKLTPLNDVWFGRKLMQFVPSSWNVTKGQKGKHTTKGLQIKGVEPSQTTI
jgi:P4 family phage/plasmid primase-like protien